MGKKQINSRRGTYDGIKFASQLEISCYKLLQDAGIEFKYEDTNTFLANRFLQITQTEWGALQYEGGTSETIDGELYSVKAPFSHVQFERLTDANTNGLKLVQYGYNVNESQSAYLGKPLLFYSTRVDFAEGSSSPVAPALSYVAALDADNNPTQKQKLRYTNAPSNSLYLDGVPDKDTIHFETEVNEWTGDTSVNKTLFKEYYEDYIIDTFSLKRRLTKVTAYLPIKIFTKLKLRDRIVIRNQSYKINQITTNLLTGKSQLELLNEV